MIRTSRRAALAGMVGTAATVVGTGGQVAQAAGMPFGPGPRSGLPWNSGASLSSVNAVAAYRNRLCDTVTLWCKYNTWDDILSFNDGVKSAKSKPERISIAISPLPRTLSAVTTPGVWALAASGAFDFYYAEWSRRLQATGRTDYIVRVGWECNHTFPWFAGADPANYILTHRRIVDFIRLYNPTVTIEWCNTKKGKQSGSVLSLYPGNDWVDIVGVDYYDVSPPLNDQATWDKQYMRLYQGGPWGIGAWLEFAKANGKLFACAEWGIRVGMTPANIDNPFYIRKMFEFFSANASYIAYENYFNQKPEHQVAPATVNPLAAAEYLRLWGRPLV